MADISAKNVSVFWVPWDPGVEPCEPAGGDDGAAEEERRRQAQRAGQATDPPGLHTVGS